MKIFRKRIFNLKIFLQQSYFLFINFGQLKDAFKSKQINSSFRERIMLSVTQVNKCVFCSYGHTKAALAAGIPDTEINQILGANFTSVPQNQKIAICFAQYYAQNNKVGFSYTKTLINYYGKNDARHIVTFSRFMVFCNLCGNTIEAFFLWFTMQKISGTNFFNIFIVVILMMLILPFILIFGLLFR